MHGETMKFIHFLVCNLISGLYSASYSW